jgi:hypothetical protein
MDFSVILPLVRNIVLFLIFSFKNLFALVFILEIL